jgi:hypothetical protein
LQQILQRQQFELEENEKVFLIKRHKTAFECEVGGRRGERGGPGSEKVMKSRELLGDKLPAIIATINR